MADVILNNRIKIEPLGLPNEVQLDLIRELDVNLIEVQPPNIEISTIDINHTEYPKKVVNSVIYSDITFILNAFNINIINLFNEAKNDAFNFSITLLDLNLEPYVRINCYLCKIKFTSLDGLSQINPNELLNINVTFNTSYVEFEI